MVAIETLMQHAVAVEALVGYSQKIAKFMVAAPMAFSIC